MSDSTAPTLARVSAKLLDPSARRRPRCCVLGAPLRWRHTPRGRGGRHGNLLTGFGGDVFEGPLRGRHRWGQQGARMSAPL